ncbi:MAG: ABC transporter ATP-binding protein [Candidatus Devosia phytovorans]|uniref:ABC transporter ATP-binding protein n=1 Tax=Candidatus Devosia phytovorans TaxID=3121372 RepID=A0AAJ5VQU5_9HYPH|nr:ABC transporter ATP-binding protein [Devosia sp.]WEK02939.1 MAG: ABC transporter ATP-binding protein [Devosia sp.]
MDMTTTSRPVLSCEAMTCELDSSKGPLQILQEINFSLDTHRALGIVGESGAGKSMLIKAIMGIAPRGMRMSGKITLDGDDLSTLSPKKRAKLVGRKVGIVFQNPMTSLNPFVQIGRQIEEAGCIHLGLSKTEARTRAIELLSFVGMPDPEDCYDYYPHQFSGGMKQRIMIAAALICQPDLLIADEATTALDVTVQKEVLDLLQTIQAERQMSMILVSHNLGVVAGRTDEILVLYGGNVVEYGPTREVFRNPRHRYTEALLSAMPHMDQPAHSRLRTIPGQPPNLANRPVGCPFSPRCPSATQVCHDVMPAMSTGVDASHRFACHNPLPEVARPASAETAHVQ